MNSTTAAAAASSSLANFPFTAGTNGIPVYFTQFETEVTLAYDFDLWGKNRNTWVAALGEMWARAADESFKRLEISIAVAQVYYRLQINYKRAEINRALVENQTQYLNIVQQRLRSHIESLIPIQLAQANLSSAEQRLTQVKNEIAIDEYRLKAYLAGNFLKKSRRLTLPKNRCLKSLSLEIFLSIFSPIGRISLLNYG